MVSVTEVKDRRGLKKFVDFVYDLYENHDYYVPPLRSDVINTLDWSKNPAFLNAQAKYWIAYKDGKAAGRIAAIFLEKYEEKWKERRLRFGWFDFIDDKEVVDALIGKVEAWAAELRVNAIHGPMGFTDLDPEGLLIDGFDKMGSMLMIYNYPYYSVHLERCGYTKEVDWIEYAYDIPKDNPQILQKMAERVERQSDLHLIQFKKRKEIKPYIDQIFTVYNNAYDGIYGTLPLSDEQINLAVKQYLSILDPDFVLGIVDGNGVLKGFGVAMINLDTAVKKSRGRLFPLGLFRILRAMKAENTYITMLLIGLDEEIRRTGAVTLMLNQIVKVCRRRKINRVLCLPELEDNKDVQSLWKFFETEVIKRRRAYVKYYH